MGDDFHGFLEWRAARCFSKVVATAEHLAPPLEVVYKYSGFHLDRIQMNLTPFPSP